MSPHNKETIWQAPARCLLSEADKASAKGGEPEHQLIFPLSHDSTPRAHIRIILYQTANRPPKIELVSSWFRTIGRFYRIGDARWQFTQYNDTGHPILDARERMRAREILKEHIAGAVCLPEILWPADETPQFAPMQYLHQHD